jgi:hypothetical protein
MESSEFDKWWNTYPFKDNCGSGFTYDVSRKTALDSWNAAIKSIATSKPEMYMRGKLSESVPLYKLPKGIT